jgi:hypothetical protein
MERDCNNKDRMHEILSAKLRNYFRNRFLPLTKKSISSGIGCLLNNFDQKVKTIINEQLRVIKIFEQSNIYITIRRYAFSVSIQYKV